MKKNELLTRAVEHVIPLDLAEKKLESGEKLRLYFGIDPTGAKLHLGHAVPLRKMQQFAEEGHEVVLLIGSFTAMIGDPTGRDQMREPLNREQVQENFEDYKRQAQKIVDFSKVQIRYNHEWLEKLDFEDIVSLASNFTVQQMLERDMFQKRLDEEKPIALHEFLYPLMVGFDSVVLDVDCEIGGSDQEFNMLAGRTLQTSFGKKDKFVLTTRLIEGTDGRKMSKTFKNCIYLDDDPDEMYGKLLSIKDELIVTYLECCTDVSMESIKEIESKIATKSENPKKFKMFLAREIVRQFYGDDAARNAEERFELIFKERQIPPDIEEVQCKKGVELLDIIMEHDLAPSRSEARRMIQQGGVSTNQTAVPSINAKVGDGLSEKAWKEGVVLKVGKRKFIKLFMID